MNWIAKIIHGKADEFAHARLVKFGIGEHVGPRAELRITSSRITFKVDMDLEKAILKTYLATGPEGSHKVKGSIITYDDRREEFAALNMPLEFKKKKKKGGTFTFQAKINEQAARDDIAALLDLADPETFYLLDLSPKPAKKPWKLKTKARPQKPVADEEEAKAPNFCTGALDNTDEVKDYLFDELIPDVKDKITEDVKSISVVNLLHIEDIEIPDDPNMSFKEKRKQAKKRGKLVRTIDIDGEEHSFEYEFFV
ncbi:MAG: hypothetical protein BAJATHORv1_30221 [Candidatus Thorarchaeota archaeon]|nr:MAG: hypothetical protein BAJATHORv1_30221 [Candidatus Thorarchaeota archaeon]